MLITDLMLPGASGAEVGEVARKWSPETKILFISGHSEAVLDTLGPAPRDAPLLRKPFALQDVSTKINELLGLQHVHGR